MKKQAAIIKFKKILKSEGLKCTPQRLSVLIEIMQTDEHRECEDIYNSLKKKKQTSVSRATVYRTVDILVKHDYVRKLEFGDGKARFEFKAGLGHHDHLICIKCGKIIEFVDEIIENRQEIIVKQLKFKLVRHIHQLFGVCSKCPN